MLFQKRTISLKLLRQVATACVASAFITPVVAQTSDTCRQRYSGNDHMLSVCNQFPPDKIVSVTSEEPFNVTVTQHDENTLFIMERVTVSLSGAAKLRGKQSILPATSVSFFNLIPTDDFSSAGDPLFCLIKVDEKGAIAGVKSDASTFSHIPDFAESLINPNKPVTLIYTRGVSEFRTIRMHLKGSPGMDYIVWADNDTGRTNIQGDTTHTLVHNYIEGNGAATAVSLELPAVDDEDKKENVHVENNIIITGGNYPARSHQKALNIENGCGTVRSNHLSFADTAGLQDSQIRHLLFMRDVDGTSVSQTVFHSSQSAVRTDDQLVHLHETSPDTLKTSFISNLGANLATAVAGNATRFTGEFTDNFTAADLPALPTPDEFFSRGALAGTYLSDRYQVSTQLQSQKQQDWTTMVQFASQNMTCPVPEAPSEGLSAGYTTSLVLNGIQFVENIGLIITVAVLVAKIRGKGPFAHKQLN